MGISGRFGRTRLIEWAPAAIIASIGVTVSVLAFGLAVRVDDARVRDMLEVRVEWRARDLDRKLAVATDTIRALAIFIATRPQMTEDEFHRFARLGHAAGDATAAVTWSPFVARQDRAAFVAAARRDEAADFDILERAPDGRTIVAADRDFYLPVLYGQEFGEKGGALGIDLMKRPERLASIEAARDEGRPIATPPTRLFSDADPSLGFLVFWPVYRTGEVPATIAERRQAARGMAVGSFILDRVLAAALADTPQIVERIDFLIEDGGGDGTPQHVATYDPGSGKIIVGNAPVTAVADRVTLIRGFEVLGRHWTLVSHFPPGFVASLHSNDPWAWLVLCLLCAGLVAAYVQLEHARRSGVETIVALRTADLERALATVRGEMVERARIEAQLVQAQKMEAIGNLTGGVAHDFNNLLGTVIGNLDLLRPLVKQGAEANELVGESLTAALRGAELARRLLAFARRQPLRPEPVNPNELVAGMVQLLGRTLGETIEISLELAPDIWPVIVDPAQLEASLINLATNARDAMPKGGSLMIVTGNRILDENYAGGHPGLAPGDYAMIEVSDTGIGMAQPVVAHVFEPFFTTKERDMGSGLGLATVFGFVKQSGGHINAFSEPEVGTSFRLYLPRVADRAGAARNTDKRAPVHAQGETVLAVEDNPALRRVVVRQLKELGYRVLEAENVASALELLQRQPVDLVFSDIVMPGGGDGFDLARAALERWPALKLVLTSGFPDLRVGKVRGPVAKVRMLSKPYRKEDLARTLRETFSA